MISLISALAKKNVIGINNTIPWYLPKDLEWFKNNTLNKPIIMGYNTFTSIGHPLPNRLNIVLSKNLRSESGVIFVNSLDNALISAGNVDEVMIIGGECIYNQFLIYTNRMYLTHININIIGDTYFPIYTHYKWKTIFSKYYNINQINPYDYYFEILERY
ncbi:Dihydrofolate reductase [Serratia symbiotica]|nr:Dihydrofolate reductase [Serratia symbiotica]